MDRIDSARLDLHQKLENILGSKNVYFQPPETIRMEYPAIVYSRMMGRSQYGNNRSYIFVPGYQLTYITKDPDDTAIIDKLFSNFSKISYDRHFVNDNLHHDSFTLFYNMEDK